MIFQRRQKRETLDFSITLNSTHINCVKEVVFLGVVLDEHVTWKPHISRIANKVSKAIGLLCKSRFYISKFFIAYPILLTGLSLSVLLYNCSGFNIPLQPQSPRSSSEASNKNY